MRRMASSVDSTGMPYSSPAQPSSTVISSSRSSRPSSMSVGRVAGDAVDLVARLVELCRGVDADARAGAPAEVRSRPANPAIMPACVEPVTVQTTIVSKNTPSSRSCSATSWAQLAKPRPPSRWSDAPAGIAYGVPPAASTSRDRLLPRLLEPDAEPGGREPHVGAHEPRQQDVADPVVHRVRPVDPVLLHEHGLQPEVRGDGGDLPGVVGLHAADRHERVGALRERVGHEVLELAGLVAAEREAAVARPRASPRCGRRPDGRSGGAADAPGSARTSAGGGGSRRVPCGSLIQADDPGSGNCMQYIALDDTRVCQALGGAIGVALGSLG